MAEKSASNKEQPLAGVVLCFTSILPEQRTELATVASQMGAAHKYDLTSDVTHLIIGEINTLKYKFVARERPDVIVLRPEWVEAVRQSWMLGEDTDIRKLEAQYRPPTFDGLNICITGFEDMAFRNYVQDTTNANGASFKKDLTKDVTHLVALNTEGQKYKFATQWNIKVVTINWFDDSLERGMILEETLYHPLLPEEKQGLGAWNRAVPTVKEKAPEKESSSNPRPRKLRRVASAKLGDQNEGIWGDIVGTGFENSTDLRRSLGSQQIESAPPLTKRASIIQEVKSFASETTMAEAQESRQPSSEAPPNRPDGFLQDCFFFVHGFSSKQTSVLRHHLSFNGAQLVDFLTEFSRPDIPKTGHGLYTIVPYKIPRTQIPSTDDLAFECEVVTDMWLEKCLDAKSLVPPESHVANTPVPKAPIPGFNGMKVCSTGVSRIDLLHLSKLVNLIGASYNEYLTPSASVLICNDPGSVNQDKLRHTSEWGVPAVTANWLWDSIRRAQKQPFEQYTIRNPFSQSSKDLEVRSGSRPEKKRRPEDAGNTNKVTSKPRTETKPQDTTLARESPVENSPTIKQEKTQKEKLKAPSNPPSEPQRKPTPPTKDTITSPAKRKASEANISAQSASDLAAVSGFLKQARAANSRSSSENNNTTDNTDNQTRRKRKPLLGRAPSHSSARTAEQQHKGFSRASSIDTLNEDGCGSAIESTTDGVIPSLGNNTSSRLEFPIDRIHEDDETQSPPPMTQLNYEDPDSLAMREKFLNYAGKLADKPASTTNQTMVIGELENAGWTGRRTRNAGKLADN